MQSDTSSSSAKRSQSGGPSNDGGVSADDQTITDIDAYMAEQGEADIPTTIQLPEPTPHQNGMTPPIEKLAAIKKLREQPLKVGDTWYIVARRWYKRWEKACTGEVDKEGGVEESTLGPVDNSSLLDKDGNITSALVEGIDAEFVPEDAWALFVTWYGEPAHPLPRNVIVRGILQETVIELRPPRLKVLLLEKSDSTDIRGPPQAYVTMSINDTVRYLCARLAATVRTDKATPVNAARIWKVEGREFDGSLYPSNRLRYDGSEVITPGNQTLEEAMIGQEDAFVVEFLENGSFIIDLEKLPGKSSASTTPMLPSVQPPIFGSGDDFFSQLGKKHSNWTASSSSKYASSSKSNQGFYKSTGFGSINTRSQTIQEPGTLGLGNMGNTCFMNSALQCLAHTKELTDYFLTGVYQEELNPDNPLGMHGAIAEAFGALLHRIWAPNSTSTTFTPREFKQQLQRFAPQFSGYQQHDSQELVAFLLDGLHEDLNRVLKKPYVEKPDWQGGGDKELVELAQKSWEGYMMRNDSVIVDLFQGQYQSTLVCPECQKVSITFDPFMYLTLPLPMQRKWKHEVYYIPWDLANPHVKVPVEISRDASFKDLRHMLGRWMGAQPDNLLTMETFSHKFYKNLDDNIMCGEMGDNDVIVCYELPCHAQQSRTYKKQSDDPFIVPVFLSDNGHNRYSYRSGPSLFGYPFIAVIDQKQATDVAAMYDAIIARLERWTMNARDLYTWEAGSLMSTDDTAIQIITGVHLPMNAPITEIKENGDVITVDDVPPEEGDIADQKSIVIQEADTDVPMDTTPDSIPRKTGTKKDIFQLRLQVNHKDFGTGYQGYGASSQRYETWDNRQQDADVHPVLLRKDDALFCEFDENMKTYYFGGDVTRWEHARWGVWDQFLHPEYIEAKMANAAKKNKGMSLADCLTEFTKEEQLGDDDLWYCPQCKKHQHATKKFDLWKAPDILVVHLKRFSNSRTLRDKIDALVDFPIDGLDLGDLIGERQVAKRLKAAGIHAEKLGLGNLDEPLIYDLFAVDEHMGGLGGGHYRAYASNHLTEQWYHFDDSYVTKARASDAVNANAYLLFYKRRTCRPLGGKSHDKIEEARLKQLNPTANPDDIAIDTQLPTPPNESSHSSYLNSGTSRLAALVPVSANSASDQWPTPHSNAKSSPASTPPPLEDPELPSLDNSQFDEVVQTSLDPLQIALHQYDLPDPSSSKASPTWSNEAEPDLDQDRNRSQWDLHFDDLETIDSSWESMSGQYSDSSSVAETHPFADQREEKDRDTEEIPINENKSLDVDI
jgi:ubiquitin carboxyl-terminal hydrolase 4/11/15